MSDANKSEGQSDKGGEGSFTGYLDRYEAVANGLPGAAALLALIALDPQALGRNVTDFANVSLGGFGIFAVASFVFGNILQAFALLTEEMLNLITDGLFRTALNATFFKERRRFLRAALATIIDRESLLEDPTNATSGRANPETVSRRRYYKDIKPLLRYAARASRKGRMRENFTVNYGLHRGLSMAALLAAIVSFYEHELIAAGVSILVGSAMVYRAVLFGNSFEAEILRDYLATPLKA